MFCPKCGTQNELNKGFCRQCGQALSGVQVALEGSADQSLQQLKAGQKWIGGGSAIVAVFSLIGLVIAILGFALNDMVFSNIALINLFLGLVVGLPLIYVGKASLKRAGRLLSKSQTKPGQSSLGEAQGSDNLLTTGLKSDRYRLPVQGSVTEHTTLELRKSERVRDIERG